jgi:uncharacterized membrane protein (TIGR02234 family)
MRRQFGLVLLLGAVGAALVVFAVRQTWAQAVFTPPRPLPAQQISVTGQQLVPLASALALAALACLAAVIATRSVARRVAGALLAALGAGAAVAAGAGVRASSVLATAQGDAAAGALGGSTTGGTSPGSASHAIVIAGSPGHVMWVGAPWHAAAIVGAAAIILAGLATVWRGPRWPVMSARFDRPGQPHRDLAHRDLAHRDQAHRDQARRQRAADSASMWESLSRDLDPTVQEDQVRDGPSA